MPQLHQAIIIKFAGALLIIVLGAAALEAVIKSWRSSYDWRAFWCSFGDLIGRRALELLPFSVAIPIVNFAWQHRLFSISLSHWWTWLLLFIGEEFCYYWYHRASHQIRWFWATHAVHHSPNELNFANAYRLGWTGKLTGTPLFFAPLMLLGFEPTAVLAAVAINLLYQFWLHADWIPKLGWFEYVFNTPSHHRVHHACNIEYLDANYGGVIILFDRWFGTYIEERADVPCRYGLVKPLRSNNPFYIAMHEWLALSRDLSTARSLRECVAYVVGPPGWSSKCGTTTAELRRNFIAHRDQASAGQLDFVTTCNNLLAANSAHFVNDRASGSLLPTSPAVQPQK